MEEQRGRSGSGFYASLTGALARAQLRRLQFGWAVSAVGGWVFFVALDVTCERGAYPPVGAGDVFGEIALLQDVPRTATVTARDDCVLYSLDRESFLNAVSSHVSAASAARRVAGPTSSARWRHSTGARATATCAPQPWWPRRICGCSCWRPRRLGR
jgi:CRP-like cAMP-binding protein